MCNNFFLLSNVFQIGFQSVERFVTYYVVPWNQKTTIFPCGVKIYLLKLPEISRSTRTVMIFEINFCFQFSKPQNNSTLILQPSLSTIFVPQPNVVFTQKC